MRARPFKVERGNVVGRVVLEGKVVQLDDVETDPEFTYKEAARTVGVRTMLGAPLLRQEKVIGVIVLQRRRMEPFTTRQIELVTTFADQAVIAIENVRLFEAEQARSRELAEALEQQTATSEVLQIISSSPGAIEPVLQAMLENAVRICEAKFGQMFLVSDGRVRQAASVGVPPALVQFNRDRGDFQPFAGGPMAVLLRTRQPVHTVDVSTDAPGHPLAEIGGARSIIAVPMLKQGELIGAFAVYRQEVRPFTEKQIELVTNFAAQAVIAVENARLLSELRESLQQQTATADVLKVISRSIFDLQTVLDTLVQSAAKLCEADMASMNRPKDGAYEMVASYGYDEAVVASMRGAVVPAGRDFATGRAAQKRRVVHIHDVRADPEYKGPRRGSGYRTMLGVPLMREETPIGVIVLGRRTVRPFTEKQIELVTTFADQAVIAIENVRLFDEVQARTRELSEALEQQTATSEVLKVISSSPGDLKAVFDAMLDNATRICGAELGTLELCRDEGFAQVAMHGAPPAYVEFRHRNPVIHPTSQSALGRLARSKQLVHVTDMMDIPESARGQLAKLAGARTLLAVPLLKDNELLGAMGIYRQEPRPFTDKQIELVQNFAAQAVIAIENTRLLNELRQRTDDLSEALDQQTATSEVLKVISSSPGNLEPVFDNMLRNAVRICEARFGNLFLLEGDRARAVAVHGEAMYVGYWQREPFIALPENRGIPIDRVVQSKDVVHATDMRTDESYLAGNPRIVALVNTGGGRAFLAVPMIKDTTVIGVIAMYRQVVRPFTDKQIELVQNFAAQAVIAIENTRLLNELRESLQQQTATADVLKVISRSTFDLKTVLNALVKSATRLCAADKAAISRPIGDVVEHLTSYGYTPEHSEYMQTHPIPATRGTVAGRVLLDRKVVHIPDVTKDQEYTLVDKDRFDVRTLLGVPLMRDASAIGVIILQRATVQPFTDKQIELAITFADQAVIAIENVRLFESVEARTRELAKSLDDLRTAQDRLVQTEKLASLGQLTAGIAHEIKNPLNFVNNFSALSVELIDELREALAGAHLDSKLRAEISEIADMLQGNLDKVVQHGKRADSIVKNMLLHSRQGSGEHRPVDINTLVEESLNLAYHGARAEKQGFNISLERSFDPAAGEVDVFPQEITRVLLNLISNGFYAATKRKAEADGSNYEPALAAGTRNLGDSVEIRIRDNGTGISPEVKEKMFNPFFTTKPAGEGTGLGLSISHDIIVKQHSGSIEVDTKPGEFTEFKIVLPREGASLIKSGGRANH